MDLELHKMQNGCSKTKLDGGKEKNDEEEAEKDNSHWYDTTNSLNVLIFKISYPRLLNQLTVIKSVSFSTHADTSNAILARVKARAERVAAGQLKGGISSLRKGSPDCYHSFMCPLTDNSVHWRYMPACPDLIHTHILQKPKK